MPETDLQDLIDFPEETEVVEYKEWLDLKDNLARAKLARHLCALSNFGGGYLIFGFRDSDLMSVPRSDVPNEYNRDELAGIIARYLTPTFQCQLIIQGGYPIVVVPPLGRMPVFAKRNGPADDRGQSQGIRAGTIYTRSPKPESVPADSPELLRPVLRRAALNERDWLLKEIASLMERSPAESSSPMLEEVLRNWDARTEQRFAEVARTSPLNWAVPIHENFVRFSFCVEHDEQESLPPEELKHVLTQVNNEVKEVVWTGWSMFYPFTRPEIRPKFVPEDDSGEGVEILETNLLADPRQDLDHGVPDFWRVAADGRASLVRPYREDRQSVESDLGRPAGSWLSPLTVARETTEVMMFASRFAKRFETGTAILFRITWAGIKDRHLREFSREYDSVGTVHPAEVSQRVVQRRISTAQITADWCSAAAELVCPVVRIFGLEHCGPDFIRAISTRFRPLG